MVVDAATAIQAFTMNAFGCLDNIAWIWVYEKDIKSGDGTELQRKNVGLRFVFDLAIIARIHRIS